ncbi:divergent polysaccharide deacetylase family protein [Rhodobacter sp. KR11]|uniref:divergent polysaccharide deacetylase family protein n=1 Tax=Rhodobacter sp. KR11 TaxID=2974588 RepID=UPI002222C186|nr:divergent polysaccharide deacetylase family protein [Rhodobacter sp. KR11]MCW1919882.1 divergent polysaccharide deacetylase family protein [Rhodobacter sp. KR11]
MARGFAGGIIWGAALVGTGLVALSQLSPMPQEAGGTSTPAVAEGQGEAPAPNPASAPALAPVEVPAPAEAPVAEPGPATKADPQTAAPAASVPAEDAPPVAAASEATAPQATAPEAAVQDATQAPAPAPDGALTAPRTDGSASGVAGEGQTASPPAADPVAEGLGSPDTASQSPPAAPQDPAAVAPTAPEGQGTASTPPQTVTPPQAAAPESQSAESKAGVLAPPLPLAEAPTNAPTEALPPLPTTPSAETAPPSLAALDEALTAPPPDASPGSAALGVTEAPQDPAQAPQGTPQDTGLTEPARLPQLSQEPDPGLDPQPLPQLGAPQAEAPPEAAPAPEAAPQLVQPDDDGLPGQRVAGLPQAPGLSAKPAGTKPAGDPSIIVNDLPQIGADAAMGMDPADTSPLRAFARPFDGAEGKPLFVILLRDVGDQGLPRDQLAQLPFPVSVVIDPLAPGAAEAARAWRAAGQEVVMLANGLPQGATAADVAQSFQAMGAILPEAVAVLDPPEAGFQSDRALATLVLSEIAAEGRGLLTWDRGLNAADQIARRDGLPAALIYRELDGDNESQPVMTRYLDRAAFKAGQEGAVVVIGDTRSETVEAILGWALEGKGANVALAPVSALLLAGK